jgi:signal transduction histidine kinase
MEQPEAPKPPPSARGWAALAGMDNRLVRAVAGAPATVRTKLLVAFFGIAVLLVLVAVLGLRFLGQANGRVEGLGTLQLRSAAYENLQTEATELRALLEVRDGGDPSVSTLSGLSPRPGGVAWVLVDKAIASVVGQLEPSTNEATYDFVPPPADERLLQQIRRDYRSFARALTAVSKLDGAGVTGYKARPFLTAAINADQDLFTVTNNLADRTSTQTEALIAANRSAYTSSRNLFVGVGAISVVLALGLGLILSWSLVGPIQRTEARLAEIAAGDFSGRLDVPNRDELGSLGANVNRMNDELRRVYGELETASQHKSEFLANMSHELRTPLNAIIGFSQVLRERMFGDVNAKQEEYLDDILSSGNHLLALINDVLDLSKVEAGQVELEVADFSLPEALERGVVIVRERVKKNRVDLSL